MMDGTDLHGILIKVSIPDTSYHSLGWQEEVSERHVHVSTLRTDTCSGNTDSDNGFQC